MTEAMIGARMITVTERFDGAGWPATARTDVGRVRANNEDACAAEPAIWLVADGLGGHAGGELASAAAIAAALRTITSRRADGSATEVLNEAFAAAHEAVRVEGRRQDMASMGTTLVAAYVDAGGRTWVGCLGDSRAYFWSGGDLEQLTTDDNYAADLVAAGVITHTEARTHPGQFMLTKALIADDNAWYPPAVVPVVGAGRLLLCSDGLNSELADSEIAHLLADGDVTQSADALVRAAVNAGGRDNVTVVCIDVPG